MGKRGLEDVPVTPEQLEPFGLEPEDVSPVRGRWSSVLDPGFAEREHGLSHPPLAAWLPGVIEHVIATRGAPPKDLAHRSTERLVATRARAR